MRKVWLVVQREYLTRVRTKSFILSTVALPLITIGLFAFPLVMAKRRSTETLKIAILDEAGGMASTVAQGLGEKDRDARQPSVEVVRHWERLEPPETAKIRQELRAQVEQGSLDGFLLVPADVLQGASASFYTKNAGDRFLAGPIRRALSDAAIARRLKDRGVRVENLRELVRGVPITLVKVTQQGEVEEKGQTLATAMVLILVLYVTLLVYGLATMRSVLEEKTTRIVEILVSSLQPFELLAGKMLGVAAVGFTQYLIWALSGALLTGLGPALVSTLNPAASPLRLELPVATLVYLLIFYLAGYFLYSALYAAAGAIVSSEEEAQQVQMPMTLLIVASLMLFTVIMNDPNSTASVVLSLIPFFSPILMVLRIAVQPPPFWQIALAILLTFGTAAGIVYISARIYRVGILMYGKRPSLVEVVRWLRYT
jgi:ABC-2 type transport system permease protein